MLRNNDEEAEDREQEANFWQEWETTGQKTDCLGTVAKVCILMAIIIQSVIQNLG